MLPTEKTKKVTDPSKYIYLIYGQPKAGKTTFAAKFPDALFFAFEPGHKFQEIYKMDFTTWTQVKDAIKELLIKKKEHNFKTVIWDTADIAFQLCEKHVCKQLEIDDPSALGFGKGYKAVRKEFLEVINTIGQYGFGLIFISHSQVSEQTRKNRKVHYTDTTLSGTARKVIHPISDMIFYVFEDEGRHLMRTKGNENFNAGDRSGILPEYMNLDYDELINTFKTKYNKKETKK